MADPASPLKDRILEDVKAAMRAGDKRRLQALRSLSAAIKQREVDERVTLDDAGTLAVLEKQVKQRRESLESYRGAGRDDLADQEAYELELLEGYLPTPLSAEELDRLIDTAVADQGASSMRDMGKVMAALKPQIQGKADMSEVSARVKQRLSG